MNPPSLVSRPMNWNTAPDIWKLNSRGRLDYSIQEGVLENPYFSALSSHTQYWGDSDVGLFLLKELYEIKDT